jgi:hypothetical protein
LQNILAEIGLKTKNSLLEFSLGFLMTAIFVAGLMFFLGKPAMQPIEHLLQKSSLWPVIFLAFLGIVAQTIFLCGVILTGAKYLNNTQIALILSVLVFGLTFETPVFRIYFNWFLIADVGLTGLFFGLIFVVSRSLWIIFGIRGVLNVFEVSIKDLETTFFESQRILEQSKPPSKSLGIILVSGPSFDGDLQRYIWFAMNLASVILIAFLVLQKRKMVLVKNGRKSS